MCKDNLELCPFCGKKAWTHEGFYGWTVECNECMVNIGWFRTKEEAMHFWNTRYNFEKSTEQND